MQIYFGDFVYLHRYCSVVSYTQIYYGGGNLPVSKAQQKAVNKYMAEKYDRINLVVPKGRRDELRAQAEAAGKSLNSYLIGLIEGETQQYITPEALNTAIAAAEAAGEPIQDWITRAIKDTASRDEQLRLIFRK